MKNILKEKNYLIFAFFIVSILSWFGELGYSYIIQRKITIPGVLYGPWCPIYGTAFILLFVLLKREKSILKKIIKIFLVVLIVEYLSSFICEYFFKQIAWDYTNYPLNIQGRVCLHMTLLFTIIAYFFMNYIEPKIKRIYNIINYKILNTTFIISFLLDLFLTITQKK